MSSEVEAGKANYQRMVNEVVNQGNFDVVEELFDPGYIDHSAPPGAPGGLDGVKAVFGMFRTAFPDVKFTITDMVGEDDIVATLVHGEGTNTGPFMGIPPSNLPAKWRSVGFFRINDAGHVEVTPTGPDGPCVDLYDLVLDLQAQVRKDREQVEPFIEETLRLETPVKALFRMARRTHNLGGCPVAAGDTLMVMPGASVAATSGRNSSGPHNVISAPNFESR